MVDKDDRLSEVSDRSLASEKTSILDLSPHKLDKMETLQKSNIGEQVVELNKMCSSLCMIQPRQSKADTDASMQSIVAGVRRLESNISMIADRQRVTLLNVVRFDVRKVLQTLGYIRWDITLVGGSDDAIKSIDNMMSLVRELESLNQKIEGDAATQCDLYNKMVEDYRAKEWSREYWSFVRQVKEDIDVDIKAGMTESDALRRELKNLRQTHLNSYKPARIKRLYDCVVNQDCPLYEAIVRDREKLSDDDLLDLFSFLFRYSTLKGHIDSVHLLKPVAGDYDKLFTSWAAKKYVTLLSPALMMFGGIQEKGHFPILLMVMRDLGLSPKENTPYLQMKNYANEINKVDEILQFGNDHTIFSKTFKLLGDTPFCELEYGTVGDSGFELQKIKEYQEVYHRCYTILNYQGLRKHEEVKTAAYLKEPYPDFQMADVVAVYPVDLRPRLNFLRSVLRGETLVFG